ncbi:B-cell scaffold protein with ankyrin repeats-like [Periophthalmus magnuspinnatus]|uniref:B-cell scaffold protein with ankyrin repeats-like n=1 Tax=Periophthalmus magnuspinnatus TaxID=409849 RepID=UPI002436CE9C|nr:B-cell scaffold protein with ankyrin repeats-like [Periophthalmus magnuspinnatus]
MSHTGGSSVSNVNPMSRKPSGNQKKPFPKRPTPSSSVLSTCALVPSRVPCGGPVEVFLLLKYENAAHVTEVEFSKDKTTVKVKPSRWSDGVVSVNAPDFPAGIVKVTVLSGGVTLSVMELVYYSRLEEVKRLLSEEADPVQFMCQALHVPSVETLDQTLSSMMLRNVPRRGFPELHGERTAERERPDSEVPTMLHFAAQYGLRRVLSVLLQCPGADAALRTTNRHGDTPTEVAKHHGHAQLHLLLKDALSIDPGPSVGSSVYKMAGAAGSASTANSQKEQRANDVEEEEEEEDTYAVFEAGDDVYDAIEKPKLSVAIANRPPAPTPRPQTTENEDRVSYVTKALLQKRNQGKTGLFPVLTKQSRQDVPSPIYDTFVATPAPGPHHQRTRAGSLPAENAKDRFNNGPPVQKGAIQQEKLRELRAAVIRRGGDDGVYDKINIVHHTPSAVAKESKRSSQSEKADFYNKSLKEHHDNIPSAPHTHFFWKVDKR